MVRRSMALILIPVIAVAAILGGTFLAVYASGYGEENIDLCRDPRGPRLPFDLTDEQRAELKQLVQDMMEAGVSDEEIRAAVDAKLQEWGVEVPERQGKPQPWLGILTDEQRVEIDQIVQEMKDTGASREEIKAAVDAKLEEWGIEIPEFDGSLRHPPCFGDLTEEQREEIRQMVQEMRDAGANHEEIREAVNAKLQEWGIEGVTVPLHLGRGNGMHQRIHQLIRITK